MSTHQASGFFTRRNRVIIVVGAFAVTAFIVAAFLAWFQDSKPAARTTTTTQPAVLKASQDPIQTVTQPPTAREVAKRLHCKRFKDILKSGGYSGVIDEGSCWIGIHKYAIDTFVSRGGRNDWLQLSEPLGVNPRWMARTWVAYPSIG